MTQTTNYYLDCVYVGVPCPDCLLKRGLGARYGMTGQTIIPWKYVGGDYLCRFRPHGSDRWMWVFKQDLYLPRV